MQTVLTYPSFYPPPPQLPDYYYHWSRDSALTMRTLADAYVDATTTNPNPTEAARLAALLKTWIAFEGGLQQIDTLTGTAASGDNVGEPKWVIDGTDFTGPWGRPQNDGPGLRATTMVRFLDAYLDATGDAQYVQKVAGQVKKDLDYVVRHINDKAIDLWTWQDLTEPEPCLAPETILSGGRSDVRRDEK
ncbi:Six-hairpin glycosidase-like protein [Blyttiomyces helicus]|uniref:glucan 1,4-alpha-glucosidase n=1 Tax=Blyttiomyces helicus TaxID=388810 RepID=A0A4P9VXJ1_9FUNG|nr:Six-hairpin glycosidase-like protein [Blyttiomyces helicus]|eukprot:RKO84461.1 Six-hairpin glycosidase-like protein [Blyttiomyces helicus]